MTEIEKRLENAIKDKPRYVGNKKLDILLYITQKYGLGFEIDEYISENHKNSTWPTVILRIANNENDLQKIIKHLLVINPDIGTKT